MIPPLIHFVCLPPYTEDRADLHVKKLKQSHPNHEVMVHTKLPDNFIFDGLPVFGIKQLGALLRLDALRRYGGWYFDLDTKINCQLPKLEELLHLGNKLAVSEIGTTVCQFVSCCPENWDQWDIIVKHLRDNPGKAPGYYCSTLMKRLLKTNPNLCDYIPREFNKSKYWIQHK